MLKSEAEGIVGRLHVPPDVKESFGIRCTGSEERQALAGGAALKHLSSVPNRTLLASSMQYTYCVVHAALISQITQWHLAFTGNALTPLWLHHHDNVC